MARYRKDCLPGNQEKFAKTLGRPSSSRRSCNSNQSTFPMNNRTEGPARTTRVNHHGSHRSARGSYRAFSLAAEHRLHHKEGTQAKRRKEGLTKPEQNDVNSNQDSDTSIWKRESRLEFRHGKPSGGRPREGGGRRVDGTKIGAR